VSRVMCRESVFIKLSSMTKAPRTG